MNLFVYTIKVIIFYILFLTCVYSEIIDKISINGNDRISNKTIQMFANIELKDGRYGAYVTDGKINATIPKSLSVDDVTLEQAIEMIKVKKAKGPAKHRFKKKKKS